MPARCGQVVIEHEPFSPPIVVAASGPIAAAPAPRTAGPTDGHMGDKPWLQPIPRAADGGGAGGGDVRCPEKIPFVRDLSTRKAASLFRPSLPLRPCSWPLGG